MEKLLQVMGSDLAITESLSIVLSVTNSMILPLNFTYLWLIITLLFIIWQKRQQIKIPSRCSMGISITSVTLIRTNGFLIQVDTRRLILLPLPCLGNPSVPGLKISKSNGSIKLMT